MLYEVITSAVKLERKLTRGIGGNPKMSWQRRALPAGDILPEEGGTGSQSTLLLLSCQDSILPDLTARKSGRDFVETTSLTSRALPGPGNSIGPALARRPSIVSYNFV